jgi:hypothetical protein
VGSASDFVLLAAWPASWIHTAGRPKASWRRVEISGFSRRGSLKAAGLQKAQACAVYPRCDWKKKNHLRHPLMSDKPPFREA